MHLNLLYFLLFTILTIFAYNQTDYVLVFERLEMENYDKNYINFAAAKTFKFNRTYTAINLTFHANQAFGTNLKVQIQAYKFASNEYRLFPLRLMFDVCDTITKNDWGIQNIFQCGNFPRCPLPKGNFIICNWGPDYSKFPPYVPGGRYLAELTLIYNDKEIGLLLAYSEVKPKNRWDYYE